MKNYSVAIDGPAGSGKSTLAKNIAKELKILYVDTGAMYRATALYCIQNGIDTKNEEDVSRVLNNINLEVVQINSEQRIFLNGVDVSEEIRTQQVGEGSSNVATYLPVRKKLVEIQRELAKNTSVIMDGRDIGTNVLPNAEVKIYLVASVLERARRRCADFERMNLKSDFETVVNQIKQRDNNDMTRKYNPLKKADDAIEVDSTKFSIEENTNAIISIIKEKVKGEGFYGL